ncbi:hypothetical protein BXY82_3131, partial [Gelidibacter sediminis]
FFFGRSVCPLGQPTALSPLTFCSRGGVCKRVQTGAPSLTRAPLGDGGVGGAMFLVALRRSFSERRKKVEKKGRISLFVKKKGLYICTPQTRGRRAAQARESVHYHLRIGKQKFFKKNVLQIEKRLYVCSRLKRECP